MGSFNYLFIAGLWILICAGLGLYITGIGMSARKQYSIGFKTMLITYLLGVCMLFVVITTV